MITVGTKDIMDNVYKGFRKSFVSRLSHTIEILIATFRLRAAGFHQAIASIYCVELFVPPWLVLLLSLLWFTYCNLTAFRIKGGSACSPSLP